MKKKSPVRQYDYAVLRGMSWEAMQWELLPTRQERAEVQEQEDDESDAKEEGELPLIPGSEVYNVSYDPLFWNTVDGNRRGTLKDQFVPKMVTPSTSTCLLYTSPSPRD